MFHCAIWLGLRLELGLGSSIRLGYGAKCTVPQIAHNIMTGSQLHMYSFVDRPRTSEICGLHMLHFETVQDIFQATQTDKSHTRYIYTENDAAHREVFERM